MISETLETAVREIARDTAERTSREVADRLMELVDERLKELAEDSTKIPLYTVSDYAKKTRVYSKDALYKLIQRADRNGLAESGAIVRSDGRVLIHDRKFRQWQEGKC